MPPQPEQVIAAYDQAVADVRSKITTYATTLWAARGSYRDADIDWLVSQIVPKVIAGQVRTANLTSAYIAALLAAKGLGPTPAQRVDAGLVTGGRGIAPSDVYRRPAVEMYTALANGASFSQAKDQSIQRLTQLVGTDMQMAKVRQADRSFQAAGRKGYRRVTHGKTCALCVIASTQRYWVGNLLPIHPGCDCGVADLEPNEAVSQVIDPDRLEATHAGVRELIGSSSRDARSAADYRKLVVVHEHGEYGSTLAWRDQKFTGPGDLAA